MIIIIIIIIIFLFFVSVDRAAAQNKISFHFFVGYFLPSTTKIRERKKKGGFQPGLFGVECPVPTKKISKHVYSFHECIQRQKVILNY